MDKSSGFLITRLTAANDRIVFGFRGVSFFLFTSRRRSVSHLGEHYNQFIPSPPLRLSILILYFFWCVGEELFVNLFLLPAGRSCISSFVASHVTALRGTSCYLIDIFTLQKP